MDGLSPRVGRRGRTFRMIQTQATTEPTAVIKGLPDGGHRTGFRDGTRLGAGPGDGQQQCGGCSVLSRLIIVIISSNQIRSPTHRAATWPGAVR